MEFAIGIGVCVCVCENGRTQKKDIITLGQQTIIPWNYHGMGPCEEE